MNRDDAEIRLQTPLPGPHASHLQARYQRVFAPSTFAYGAIRNPDGSSIGPWLHDVDDNWLLDFTGQVGVSVLGYNTPEIVAKLNVHPLPYPEGYAGTDFIVGDAAIRLAEKIVSLTQHFGFEKLFLATSGTKAVSVAKKACQDRRKGSKYGISFKGGFHGRTLDALASTSSKAVQRAWYDLPGQELLLHYCVEEDRCRCGSFVWDRHTGNVMSELEQFLNPSTGFIDPDEVKYILIEPLQGEGGYWIPSQRFMDEVGRCAQEYGIPLIVDEIQSGMGRSGHWWMIDHYYKVKPDLITFGKGFQVNGAVGAADRLFQEEGRESETLGNGGVGYRKLLESLYTIEHIEDHDILYNVAMMGRLLLERLSVLMLNSGELITDRRGVGLMQALEFDTRDHRDAFEWNCFQNGLMTLGCGYKSLRLLPPLDVTEREVLVAYGVMWDVMREMMGEK